MAYSSKRHMSTQCCFNAGTASATLPSIKTTLDSGLMFAGNLFHAKRALVTLFSTIIINDHFQGNKIKLGGFRPELGLISY